MKKKLSLANTEENREYEEIYLRRTIKILLSNSINHIERCLVRWTAKKTLYTQMVERFLSFPPVQQVVLNNQLLIREAAGADKAAAGAEGGQGQELVRAFQDQVVSDSSDFGDDDFEGGGGDGNLKPGGGGS